MGDEHHEIALEFDNPPKIVCTCGWEAGPSEDLLELGTAGFDHASDTGHHMREHDFDDDDD